MFDRILCVALAVTSFVSSQAIAAPRALIVGIGDYAMADADLPGIDIDVDNMKELAGVMGFKPEDVRVLADKEATLANITREMETWLRDGVGEDDPVLFYFSGHGTRVPDLDGDEPDASDEVLVAHDARFVAADGTRASTLSNVLVDDKVAELIARIPSKKVLLLIDACHSGTATRDVFLANQTLGVGSAVKKFLYYRGMPRGQGSAVETPAAGSRNFAALSAAEDTQTAIATSQGGVFTLGVYAGIKNSAGTKGDLTVAQLRDSVAAFIKQKLDPALAHNPVTSGESALIEGGLDLTPVALQSGNGPTWVSLMDIARQGKPIVIRPGKLEYAVGEDVTLEFEIPSAGYLNVITVDATDQTTVLFPNQYQSENKVAAGKLSIPAESMPFTLPATEPVGPALVVAFLSAKPVDALAMGIEGRDNSGKMQSVFTALSRRATRAIGVAARDTGFYAGTSTVVVKSAAP